MEKCRQDKTVEKKAYERSRILVSYTKEELKKEFNKLKGSTIFLDLGDDW
ncbi:MAG: hypothetical protein HZA78_11240 [Candidatus Schekmanbacteria bacterium]|nr:hypothetical protein [Candidatus Schekmanbacteria bacterium]